MARSSCAAKFLSFQQVFAVTKPQLISTSFIAVIPGGYLFYLMLMAVLHNLASMPTILQAATISMIVVMVGVMIIPLWLLIFYGRGGAVAEAAEAASTKGQAAATAAAPPAKVKDDLVEDDAFADDVEDFDDAATFEAADDDLLDVEDDLGEADDLFEDAVADADESEEALFDADDEFEFEEFEFDDDDDELR
ncbi:MAG: hypothetical protein KDA58_16225 [Planctomycetaceae bacterium]|nr:hypothetical protein [Planctomycetaceae bacterium]